MRILITGICGFVGSELAEALPRFIPAVQLFGLDSFIRPGSETNRARLKKLGVRLVHGDVRSASDFESLPPVDWVIDAAANPSVLAGIDGKTSSRQLIEHNLFGTVNMLEFCKRHQAGFALISTSRVYGAQALAGIPVREEGKAFRLDESSGSVPAGCSKCGIDSSFSVEPPLSLYGSSKLASEALALEYAHAFDLPVIVDRCGVMAGAGQFGTVEQGIFSFWVRSYAARRPLKYVGFGGSGFQVRDAMHPRDLAQLLTKQMLAPKDAPKIWNVGGGRENSMSLAELSDWCKERFGPHEVLPVPKPRRWDAPWIVMDSHAVSAQYNWKAELGLVEILEEIARHHEAHPGYLDLANLS